MRPVRWLAMASLFVHSACWNQNIAWEPIVAFLPSPTPTAVPIRIISNKTVLAHGSCVQLTAEGGNQPVLHLSLRNTSDTQLWVATSTGPTYRYCAEPKNVAHTFLLVGASDANGQIAPVSVAIPVPATGTFDTGFGVGGMVTLEPGQLGQGKSEVTAIQVSQDGQLILVGGKNDEAGAALGPVVAALSAKDGSVSWGPNTLAGFNDGLVGASVAALQALNTNEMAVSIRDADAGDNQIYVRRFDALGSSIGGDLVFPQNLSPASLASQGDLYVYVAGVGNVPRQLVGEGKSFGQGANLTLPAIDTGGPVVGNTRLGFGGTALYAVAETSPIPRQVLFSRYRREGENWALDLGYGGQGKGWRLEQVFANVDKEVVCARLQPDGTLFIGLNFHVSSGGLCGGNNYVQYGLARVNATGTSLVKTVAEPLDGRGDIALSAADLTETADVLLAVNLPKNDSCTPLAVEEAGIVTISGGGTWSGEQNKGFLRLIPPLGAVDFKLNALALQPDGKVVAGGYVDVAGQQTMAIVRFYP